MSNQSNSSVYSEKKIAAYESLFKESSFAKPQEVYLTITVAHLFGQAYIMEQQGTKEGDPIYSRFVCPLEEITKVYINDNVKSSPLFIQCDTNVKGVVHRKRIIVPCLENVASIVEQIEEVRALHMEKYEAAQQKQMDRKREALEAARLKEQMEREAREKIPPLPSVEKIKEDIPVSVVEEPVPVPVPEKPAEKAAASDIPKEIPKPEISEPVKDIKSVKALNSEIEASIKALESFSSQAVLKHEAKPMPKKPVLEPEPIPVKEQEPESVPELKPLVTETVPEPEEIKPEPAKELEKEIPAPVEVKPAPVVTPAPAAPAPAKVNPNGAAMGLDEFQTAVKKLKSMKDSGVISDEEFAAEKKKLLASLY